jgi:hypothetical protein
MYLMEKTILDYEKEIIDLRQNHLQSCYKYEEHIKDLKEIIEEMKQIYCSYKMPDDEEGESSSFYDNT